ncbi:hypothetical protein [Alicyclobacillus acidocaldarius]|uniref:Uncharacterized protein n=1 Tax=Alicyclobacillus acidocaldarius subsp. acidocaldarius (strain ATCC 27009 / DSM 446 / BCRC 14685 / JCM 5260 / KCTC 1825 / NBRC 15652 / NCIMB 11725 / NRRL B-14509 / 104-IA) TaxID=521098 RepID=C8WVT8_ALIAD|nr:hypothetical protein [Alicyclobacillus acidocaldarius]ACV58210.1 hypothetical protein Aaci_1179 [Alicyclobacillus acidocaldarius subsp. acidocaldarius DSM 446]
MHRLAQLHHAAWLRWRKAGPESSNITKILFMIFSFVIAFAFIITMVVLIFKGINTAQSTGSNAMNSITSSSGSSSLGGYSGSYTGTGNITLPNLSSSGSGS